MLIYSPDFTNCGSVVTLKTSNARPTKVGMSLLQNQRSGTLKLVVVLAAFICVLSAISTPAIAKHIDANDGGCVVRFSGFEHWGKAASSVRDLTQACSKLQAYLSLNGEGDSHGAFWGRSTLANYTRIDAGFGTDWVIGGGCETRHAPFCRYVYR